MTTDGIPRILKLINHDDQFRFNVEQAGSDPVILNTFDLSNPDYIDALTDHIFADANSSGMVAKCQCGNLEGTKKIGMTCPICGTSVSINNLLDDNHLICRSWVSTPAELPNGWLTPRIYLMLTKWLTYDRSKKRNYLDDLLDIDAETPFDVADRFPGKGFGYVHDNFDRIIEYFAYLHPVTSKRADTEAILFTLALYRDRLFCHYIPLLNSAITPILDDANGNPKKKRYTDTTADFIMSAINTLSRLEFSSKRKRSKVEFVERSVYQAYREIIEYTQNATWRLLSRKPAIPRAQIFGGRMHETFRTVIVPITAPHTFDELHAPWALMVNTLRIHLFGVLTREKGYTPDEAGMIWRRALYSYDPMIHEIIDRFILESPRQGIPCLWHRPPSIRGGSVMLKFITRVKPDVSDRSMGVGVIDVALPNAD